MIAQTWVLVSPDGPKALVYDAPAFLHVCGHDHVEDHLWLHRHWCSSSFINKRREEWLGKRREMTGGLRMAACDYAKRSEWLNSHVCVHASSASWRLMRQKRGSFTILGINWSQSIPEDQSGIFFGGWLQREMIKKAALEEKKKKEMRPDASRTWGRLGWRGGHPGLTPCILVMHNGAGLRGNKVGAGWFWQTIKPDLLWVSLRNDCQWSVWSL